MEYLTKCEVRTGLKEKKIREEPRVRGHSLNLLPAGPQAARASATTYVIRQVMQPHQPHALTIPIWV